MNEIRSKMATGHGVPYSKQRSDFNRLVLGAIKKLEKVELEEFTTLYDLPQKSHRKVHEVIITLEKEGKLCMTKESVENLIENLDTIGRQDLKEKAREFLLKYELQEESGHLPPAVSAHSHPEFDNDQPDNGASPVPSTASRETTPASEQSELVYSTRKGVISRTNSILPNVNEENPQEELQAPCDERMDVSEERDQQQPPGNDSDEDDPLQEATASNLPFIRLADEVATKSDNPYTKVGAIVVREGKVIGEGHNYLPHDAMASPHEKADTKKDEISSSVDTLPSYEAVSHRFIAGIPECDDEPPPRKRKKRGAGALDEKTLYQKKPDENSDEEQIQPHNEKDEEFMRMAQKEASNSPDPKYKVGAVIVDTSNSTVLGKGHNRMPKGCEHLPWSNDTNDLLDSKYPYVFHGAKAAIKDALEKKQDLKGATLYTTLLPANSDTQWVVELGIKEVVYRDNVFKHTIFTKAAKKIFKASGTKLRRMK